jgi:hypothetical protein
VLQEVVRKTDGVSLFVEELTKTVLALGLLEEQQDRYALHGPLLPLAIPATLHDALLARLDRLAAAKAVAQLGATIGRTFAYDVVQAVAPLDEGMLQGALAQLVEAEIVAPRGLPPQATYTFKHALIQDAAYESLLRSTRQQYHQRVAQVLAERFPDTAATQPEVLAQHYTAAGLHAQALPYWQQAGQFAIERSAYREAVGSFEQALSALAHLPETHTTREQAIDLRLALRNALQPSGDTQSRQRILVLLREAEALAEALADSRRLGHPLEGSCQEGTLSLYTIFLRCFCSCVPYCSHVERQRLRTLVSLLVVSPSCLGPHQSPIGIKVMGGSALWQTLSPPLATLLPQKTVGAIPRPKRAITDLMAPVWVQPLGGSRHGRTRCRTSPCKVAGGLGQRPIRSGGCQPTPCRAHCPSPSHLIQRPWRSQRARDRASHSSRPVPVYAPPP